MKQKTNRSYLYIGIVVVLLVIHGVMTANENKKEKESEPKSNIGEYVYIDSEGILHTSKCYIGMQVTSDNGESYLKPIYPLDTLKLTSNHLHWFCSYCVSDEDYEHLQRIVKRNTKR